MQFSFKFVFLWTDILIFIFLAALVLFVLYSSRFEHLRAPWRQFFSNKIAMISAVTLMLYATIGIMDSVHFQQLAFDEHGKILKDDKKNPIYKPDVLSLLDLILEKTKNQEEESYSSPFAIYSLSKKNIVLPDIGQRREYPRLKHGGAHLNSSEERTKDILTKGLKGGTLFSLVALSVIFIIIKVFKIEFSTSSYMILFVTGAAFLLGSSFYLSYHYHLFGTDKVGQDVFYRAIKGIRTGIVIGTLTTLIMVPFATMLGITAGYFKGRVDDVIQYIYTTLSSIPNVLLIASAVLMLQVYMDTHSEDFENIVVRADTRLLFLCMILGMSSWTGLCRILRGETLKLSQMEYVLASKALGTGNFTILARHIVPNIMHIIVITIVLDFSQLVLAEAVLTYVGAGVDPTMESWGNMINAARLELARDPVVWWNLCASFILMFGLVLAANVFADGIRDAFDPKLRTK